MKNLSLLVLLSCFLCLASLSAFIDTRVKELLLSGKRYNYQYRSLKAYSADSIVIRGGKVSGPAANHHHTWRQGYGNKDCSATVGFRCVAGNDSQI